jgi:carbonic anhydrase
MALIANQEQSVVQDVSRICEHPLVPGDISIYGFIYDVRTGRRHEVAAASVAGRSL